MAANCAPPANTSTDMRPTSSRRQSLGDGDRAQRTRRREWRRWRQARYRATPPGPRANSGGAFWLISRFCRPGRTSRPRPSPGRRIPLPCSASEPAPGPATTMSVFFDTDPATFAPQALRHRFCFFARHLLASSVRRPSCPQRANPRRLCSGGWTWTCSEQGIQHVFVVLFPEELDDGGRHHRADASDGCQLPMHFRCRIGSGFCRLA